MLMTKKDHASARGGLTAAAVSMLALSSCVVGPDYERPKIDMPDQWHSSLTDGLQEGNANLHTWWTTLGDATLNDLIKRMASGNLDLHIAYNRIREARALLQIANGERWPDIDANGGAIAQKFGKNGLGASFGGTNNAYSIGTSAFWEMDIWGRVSRIIESSNASMQATIENYRDVLVVLFAEVAANYIDLRSLQDRIQLAEKNIAMQQSTVKLTQDRFAAQLVSELDVRQAELNLARTEAFLPSLREAQAAAIHRLCVLLGENPGELHEELTEAKPIPHPPEKIGLKLPLNLLRQRPDIRRVERELAAQTARIGIATADLYPQFSLTGTLGWSSVNGNMSDLLNKSSLGWSFGPQFNWNLFDGGRVEGNIEAEKARTEQMILTYKQTVLYALEEVENALVSYSQEQKAEEALQRSVEAAQKSVELVETLYRTGVTDFQNVLDMHKSLVEQEDRLAQSEGRVVQNLVRVYKALGGGWDPDAAQGTDDEPENDTATQSTPK